MKMVTLINKCLTCGDEFQCDVDHPSHTKRGRKYCSEICRRMGTSESKKGEKNPNWGGGKVKVLCIVCGKSRMEIPSMAKNAKYCSKSCKAKDENSHWREKRIQKKCPTCGKRFSVKPSRDYRKYCSQKCASIYFSQFEDHSGENCPAWKGGITPESIKERTGSKYKEWRASVYARDNWTCLDCGYRSGKLHAHHVFPFAEFPEHRFDVWNGITLCPECHRKTHSTLSEDTNAIHKNSL